MSDDLAQAIRQHPLAGVPCSWWIKVHERLEVRFGRYGLRWVVLDPRQHDGMFLAELCGYAGA